MQLLEHGLLLLLTNSPLTNAVPALVFPHALLGSTTDSPPVCRPVKCTDDKPASHLYCQSMGCEFCLEYGIGPNRHFACDSFPASRAASASNGGNISTTDVWEIDY